MPFNRPQLRELMRRGSFLAEEVLMSSNARRGSIFASVVKHRDPIEGAVIAKVHLFAALMFVIGSMFFVYEEVAENWLLHYRIGCVLFILGCVAYLVAMGMSGSLLEEGLSSRVSDAIVIVAMVLFIVGCCIAFHPGGEQEVLKRLDLMNWIFLVGCILLFLDAVKCAVSSNLTDGLTFGNYLDLATTISFLAAAILGGKFYKPEPFIVEEGMVMWLVGSVFCTVAPFRVVAYGEYDPTIHPKKGDDHLYGAVHATLDGRDRQEDNMAYLRAASLPSNYYAQAAMDSSSDGAVSSGEEVTSSDSARPSRAFP